ncbi:MAG TPA: metallopeptidase TldD-related protein [Micromonosporaceae bacterium]|jgi:predicted Zn-dependent protease|nr:metallopeptidase TldD-related protein [Micromonosporaceae bacterium]
MTQLDLAGRIVEMVKAAAPDAETEVSVDTTALALTRFANSMIHQNVADETTTVRLVTHLDGRTVASTTTVTSDEALGSFLARTVDAVRIAPLDPGWPGLTPAAALATSGTADESVVNSTPADRAARIRAFVDSAGGLTTAGYCRTRHTHAAFANSAGHAVAGSTAEIAMDGIARTGSSDGSARAASAFLSDVDGAILGARAAAKARAGDGAVELSPGRYEVVLEQTAVADVLQALAMFGFNGKGVNERQSFLEAGAQQMDAAITFVDDAISPGMIGLPFDAEGTPKQVTTVVDAGRTVGPVQDRRTAAQAGTQSTGNAIGMSFGAFALNLSLRPADGDSITEADGPAADSSVAALVSRMSHGILVTDHWYTRVLDPRTLVMTGLTRNGAWLVENGEIISPVRNFRFTQSYPQALGPGSVIAVGTHAIAVPNNYSQASFRCPALHLASWNFTGGASG